MVFNMSELAGGDRVLRQARIVSAARAPRGSNTQDLETWGADRSFVMSFARGLSVIHAFANQSSSLTIAEISRKTKIPRAAVRRLLHTLMELGYVRQIEAEYALTPVILLLGHSFLSSNKLAAKAQPIVSRLSNELNVFSSLSVPDGDDTMLMCVSSLRAHLNQQAQTQYPNIGSRAPMYCGASGQIFLSALNENELNEYFARATFRPFTHKTPTDLNSLRQNIRKISQQRYAMVDRTLTLEHSSIAVPVLDASGEIIAALVAFVEVDRMSLGDLVGIVLPKLSSAARELSAQMA